MCGIIVTKGQYNETFIKRRGQDCRNEYEKNGYRFIHFLLSITGKFTPQPYVDGNIVMIYNGEIYNHKYVNSDGEVIIPLYKQYGYEFPKYLDGEFAIALYDFDKNIALFTTDCFATKPLWINKDECASYQSGVGGKKLEANKTIVIDLVHYNVLYEGIVYDFDFNNQHKETYDDWIVAFKESVRKRAKDNCFLGLSSGYDSGAIACELNNLGVKYTAYSIPGNENESILNQRKQLIKDFRTLKVGLDFTRLRNYLTENVERFKYIIKYSGTETNMVIHDDMASIGLSRICEEANKEGKRVYLSGQGADEIMSDYAPWVGQSELRGKYPEQLKPWNNFYNGCQYSYLGKEEYVAGSFNIETRYPFLDKQVVQEFLWLSNKLKNAMYKAPLTEYLTRNGFPFESGVKRGFTPA